MTRQIDQRHRYRLPSLVLREQIVRTMFCSTPPAPRTDGPYTGAELLPSGAYRPGAFDALACPSVIAGRRVYRPDLATFAPYISAERLAQAEADRALERAPA